MATFITKDNVCHVGYALNKKKMRKSSFSMFNTEGSIESGYISSTIWRGGGLADILNDDLDKEGERSGITFQPFEFDLPTGEQV